MGYGMGFNRVFPRQWSSHLREDPDWFVREVSIGSFPVSGPHPPAAHHPHPPPVPNRFNRVFPRQWSSLRPCQGFFLLPGAKILGGFRKPNACSIVHA